MNCLPFFYTAFIASLLLLPAFANALSFTRITDPNNPIISENGDNGYTGCAWIDFDNDGDEDLFVNKVSLYRNDGGGSFVRVQNTGFLNHTGLGSGCSWADYDNDGDLDVYISGSPAILYRNDGNAVFTPIIEGDIGHNTQNDIRGWACAWGDYDNDGNVDLMMTHPANFVGNPALPNFLFHNDGPPNYSFTKITAGDVVTGTAPYTVGTWSDFDLDGDQDLFIGSGPATSTPGPDYLYRNGLFPNGNAELVRFTDGPIASHNRDGQVINWIDYDNDLDLDCYITNYGGGFGAGLANELYRNDNGTYTQISVGAIVTDVNISLASVWADFDNDGDLDCIVTNDSQRNKCYLNNGDGSFTSLNNPISTGNGAYRGATTGDYDNDGDLDLFINGVGTSRRLFRNDSTTGNWLKLKLVGTNSNKSAIGARVSAKANINGTSVWQMREVSAQNSFDSHNSLIVHFGLGSASLVDSMRIIWPSGQSELSLNLAANQLLTITETSQAVVDPFILHPSSFILESYPNPFNPTTTLSLTIPKSAQAKITIVDVLGREVMTLQNGILQAGEHEFRFDGTNLPSGIYFANLQSGEFNATQKLLLLK